MVATTVVVAFVPASPLSPFAPFVPFFIIMLVPSENVIVLFPPSVSLSDTEATVTLVPFVPLVPSLPGLPCDPLEPFFTVIVEPLLNVYTFEPPSAEDVEVCSPPVSTVPRSTILLSSGVKFSPFCLIVTIVFFSAFAGA